MLALGLVLTARAVRESERLTELRSEFVSTVTHELKTPIATIRAAGDTIVRGRITSAEGLREYAELVVQEAKRLGRLVDNLLAYARITDVTELYHFDAIDVRALVDDATQEFGAQLAADKFERGDRDSAGHAAGVGRSGGAAAGAAQPDRQRDPLFRPVALAAHRGAMAEGAGNGTRASRSPSAIAASGFPRTNSIR